MVKNENKLDEKIRRNLMHENHKIRQNSAKALRNMMFEHDDEEFAARFCKFPERDLHLFEVMAKSLYMTAKAALKISDDTQAKMKKVVGKFWKTIPCKATENPLEMDRLDELKLLIDTLVVSTNIEWSKYLDFGDKTEIDLSSKKSVMDMLKMLEVIKKYMGGEYFDKIDIIMRTYTSSFVKNQEEIQETEQKMIEQKPNTEVTTGSE